MAQGEVSSAIVLPDLDQGPSVSGRMDETAIVSVHKPVVVIVIGMAGSGKTTLMQRLSSHCHAHGIRSYVINLDPAVHSVPYGANIDIRDTVNYKNVMKEYHLGPNGGILTSLNLFATKIDEVVSLVEKRAPDLDVVLLDTPGQIEIFTWSASGAIITEAFASTFPTVISYVLDTPRSSNPVTFMSNMLYACGILYKMRLPLLLIFNKIDVVKHEFALEWMADFEAFQAAVEQDTSYTSNLSRSLCLVLDEFYQNLKTVGVSAITGLGIENFFAAVKKGAEEYQTTYLVELEKRKAERSMLQEEKRAAQREKFKADFEEDQGLAGKTKDLTINDESSVSDEEFEDA